MTSNPDFLSFFPTGEEADFVSHFNFGAAPFNEITHPHVVVSGGINFWIDLEKSEHLLGWFEPEALGTKYHELPTREQI